MCSTVVKSSHVQGGAVTNRVRREISISVAINGLFWFIDLLPFCWTVRTFEKNDTAMSEKVVFQQPSAC